MFLINVTYKKPLAEIDQHLAAHAAHLDRYYARQFLITSGRKVPREGGIILANTNDREGVERFIEEDPFYREGLADYQITEFTPTKWDPRFAPFTDSAPTP